MTAAVCKGGVAGWGWRCGEVAVFDVLDSRLDGSTRSAKVTAERHSTPTPGAGCARPMNRLKWPSVRRVTWRMGRAGLATG